MRGAGRRQLLPPPLPRVGGQAAGHRPVRRRRGACFLQDSQRVELAGWLDDPGRHQVPEHLVPARRVLQAQGPVGVLQRVEQAAHPRRRDRQRPGPGSLRPQAQVKLALPGRDPLPPGGLQCLQLRLVVGRAEVLDVPRPPPRRPYDLDRRRARCRLHRPHVGHRATLRPRISAQVQHPRTPNQQVTAPRQPMISKLVLSQVRGRAELPTFRFSGVTHLYVSRCLAWSGGAWGALTWVAGCCRCRHGCRHVRPARPEVLQPCVGRQAAPGTDAFAARKRRPLDLRSASRIVRVI